MGISKKVRSWLLGLVVLALFAAGCASPVQPAPAAAAPSLQIPVISPSGGRFADASKEVSITCPTPGALIFWTDDDSTPTSQSNRFTEPFRIYGTTLKIKAVAILGTQTSAVAVATLTLNDGKSANQLGLIKGNVKLPTDVTGGLDAISIFSDDLPGAVYHPDSKGFFLIDGLNTAQAYDFYFTNQTLGPIVGTKRSLSRGVGQGPIVAIQVHEVLPAAGAGVNLNEVKLKKTGRIVGKALMYGRDGALAADHTGIDVYVPGTSFTAKTGSSGSFVLSDIPEGVYAVRADKPGYTFREVTGLVVVSEQDNNDLQTASFNVYYGYGTVTGSATLTDGSADGVLSDGIAVLLRNLNDANSTFNTVTGADGSYTLTNVEPGSYTAFFAKSGYLSQTLEGLSVQGASVARAGSVSLPAIGGKISGAVLIKGVVDSSGTMVLAQSATGKTFSTGTLADGSYRFDPIAPGTYTLTASHAGYSTRLLTGVSLSMGGAVTAQNFPDLTPAIGSLTGVVNLEGALSFEGIAVTARKSDDSSVSLSAVTDAQGTYILSDLKPGTYLVRFAKDGFLAGDGVTATLVADGIVTVTRVVLSSSKAKLAGTALLQGTSDHAGTAVLASGVGGKSYSTVTDAAGRFALVGLDPDTYTIQATKDGYTTARSDPQVLGAGAVTDGVALSLTVSSRSVVGKVTLEGLTVFSGTKITATNLADVQKIYSALSNNDGYFVLSGMVPGSYILSFSRENYKGVTTNAVSLATTSTVTIPDLRLDQARGGITGIARSEGRTSHAGTTVTLVGTSNVTTTAADGTYTFQVPSGNYPGGVRFEHTDFETTQDTGTLTVLTDSTYGVPTATLKATHNTLQGAVDLLGTGNDSGITVALDGQSGFTTTTAADGSWRLDHVPLGTVTVRFTRANTPDVTSTVVVGPADQITVPKLDMIPNASSLKGWIKLTGMTDHAGVTVTVTTENKPDLTGTTNASGAFEIGNILSTGSHTVTASKAGWVSQSFTVSDFLPLEVRTVGQATEIALVDTAAPVFDAPGVVLNSGANLTDNLEAKVQLSVSEKGSGADRMQLAWTSPGATWTGDFGTAPWQPYTSSFTSSIPSNGNGDYTLHVKVKDRAGNVSSESFDSIALTDQFPTLSGVLSGEKLHWTKEKGIYKVTGTMVVESGTELVVDPGVEVRFMGNYSLAVRGSLKMRGTKSAPIVMTSDPSYTATYQIWDPVMNTYKSVAGLGGWGGIAFQGLASSLDGYRYVSGSVVEGVNFFHGSITGSSPLLVRNCVFDSTCGNNNMMWGSGVTPPGGLFYGNEVQCSYNGSNTNTVNNWFHQGTEQAQSINLNFGTTSGNTIDGLGWFACSIYASGRTTGNVFKNLPAPTGTGSGPNIGMSVQGQPVQFNNFVDVWAKQILGAPGGVGSVVDARYNSWNGDKTSELASKSAGDNYSFLWDYYDDPINLAKIDVSSWATTPWPTAGYRGEQFCDATLTLSGTLPTNGYSYVTNAETGDNHLKLGLTVPTTNPGAQVRVSQTLDSLNASPWQAYSSTVYFDADLTKLVPGTIFSMMSINGSIQTSTIQVFCQVMDTAGNLSNVAAGSIAYDSPTVTSITGIGEGQVLNGTEAVSVNATATDAGGVAAYALTLNGRLVGTSNWSANVSDVADGAYTLVATATDYYGRVGSKTLHFTVSKALKPTGYGANVTWSADGSLINDAKTAWLWHLNGTGEDTTANVNNTFPVQGWVAGGLGTTESSAGSFTGSALSVTFASGFTIEGWVKSYASANNSASFSIAKNPSLAASLSDYIGGSSTSVGINLASGSNSSWAYVNSTGPSSLGGDWHQVAFVWTGGRVLSYLDGMLVSSSDQAGKTFVNNDNPFAINLAYMGLAELRISTAARSGDELKAYVDYVRSNNLIH